MKDTTKMIIAVISALAVIAAAVFVIVRYKDQIASFLSGVKEKLCTKKHFTTEELEDFADI